MSELGLVSFLYVAALPLALMPALIAWIARHRSRGPILAGNLALWGLGYVSVLAQSNVVLSALVALAAWLTLLAYAIRQGAPTAP